MTSQAPFLRRFSRTHLGWVLATLALAAWFFVPMTAVVDASLDASNYASYAKFTAEGRSYGTEVVPMAGPYSFVVYGWVYSGELTGIRFALELGTKLVFAALLLWFFHQARGSWTRWAWLAVHGVIVPATNELGYDLAILYTALFLLLARNGRLLTIAAVAFLAFLSLCKGTQLTFTFAVLAVVIGHAAWHRDGRRVGLLLGGYAVALGLFWVAAGQNLLNLPAYVRSIQELSSGYHEAMAVQETPTTFRVGVTTFVLLLGAIGLLLLPHRRNPSVVATAALLAGFALLQWKHGFVRADGHVFLFFHYAAIGALTAFIIDRVIGVAPRYVTGRAIVISTAIVLSLVATGEGVIGRLIHQLTYLPEHFSSVVSQLAQPAAHQRDLATQLDRSRARFALPAVTAEVGRASIDFFGHELGYLLLNGLDYQPRPVGGGSFGVFTSHLRQRNEDHLLNPGHRPQYFLLKLQTIDQRFPAQDDAGSLNALLYGYRPVMGEREMLLLQAEPAAPPVPGLRLVSRHRLNPGEEINVPSVAETDILVAAFKLPPSLAGRVRGLLYKPAIVSLHFRLADSDQTVVRRIVPSMVSRPIIVSPFLENTADVLSLYTANPGHAIRRITLQAQPSWALQTEAGTVTFYAQARPAPLTPSIAADLQDQLVYPMGSRPPDRIDSPNAQAMQIDGRLVQMIEPPGRLVFNLRGDERELRFDYGLSPTAYERGTTDGADFVVDLVLPGAAPEQLYWSRRDPKNRPSDRGLHHAHLWLPLIPAGAQLILRTAAGPHGDAQWDWTYFDNIRLRRGPPQLEQFPGFSRVPVAVEGSSPRVIHHEDKDLVLANAPCQLSFDLLESDRAVHLSVGFIPGAYTEGNTDGADFIVEVQSPDQPRRELHRVGLHPKFVPADRGPRALRVPFPALPAGSRVILRIDPGPAGNGAWDWTYIAAVRFE